MKKHHLQEILRDAQPEVKKALKRWFELSDEERGDQVLLYWLLGTGTPAYKMPKTESQYTDKALGKQNCGNCEFLYTKEANGKKICSNISGEVKSTGWCKLWKKG